jgi:hypothetical protein
LIAIDKNNLLNFSDKKGIIYPLKILSMKTTEANSRINTLLCFVFFTCILVPTLVYSQTYCTSGATNMGDTEIDRVVLNTIVNNSAGICATYTDFTNIATSLFAGSIYELQVTMGTCGGNFFKSGTAWIDYNNDGDFTDTNEYLGTIGSTTNTASLSLFFKVSNVNVDYNDSLRLRIIVAEGGFQTNSCASFSYGETEDYSVVILPQLQHDAALLSIDSPSFPFQPGNQQVKVRIQNAGYDSLKSVNIGWKVNTQTKTAHSWSGALHSGDTSASISIGSFTMTPGYNSLLSWTQNPNNVNDSNTYNDTARIDFYACSPLVGGTYTIGPGVNDSFASFTDAVFKLSHCGISGSVVFKVANGTYYEQIEIPNILGTSSSNTITFESASGDSSSVILTYAPLNTDSNYTVKLTSAKYITFSKITLQSTGLNYATAIYVSEGSSYNSFQHCHIKNNTTNSTSSNYRLVYLRSSLIKQNFNSFQNNYLENGSYGLYWLGLWNNPDQGNLVESNYFVNQYYKCMLFQHARFP